MKQYYCLLVFTFLYFGNLNGQSKHFDYLQSNSFPAIDYMHSLFKENDLIIICEREHPELTQYDFFFEIVSQDWFVNEVGTVICEVASRSIQPKIDSVLFAENLTEDELHFRIVDICRNMTHHVCWLQKNFYTFLKNIYYLNQNLTYDKKIKLLGADVPISWDDLKTKQDVSNYESKYYPGRDKYMADLILNWYKEEKGSKALIVMNTRHAFMNYSYNAEENNKQKTERNRHLNNVGAFIDFALPDKSTNVMLHSFTYIRFFSIRKRIAGGSWDKAFCQNNNLPCGLPLKDSPFGNNDFDYFPFTKTNLKWKDVFEHLIFYNPICKFETGGGVNGFVDLDFEEELRRRYRIKNYYLKNVILTKRKIKNHNTGQSSKYNFRNYCE